MPHFVIDCASSILDVHDEMTINQMIHKIAHRQAYLLKVTSRLG